MTKMETFLKSNYTIFFSHQWLAYGKPDPTKCQLKVMKNATKHLSSTSNVPIESTFVWCDYFSIAQENAKIQQLAILSLPAVASSLHAFVMVTPKARHQDTQELCDLSSYKNRGWCRAEVFSHIARRGNNSLFVAEDSETISKLPSSSDLTTTMCDVFGGNFTCCRLKHKHSKLCDRQHLVAPMLGLYCEIYKRRFNKKVSPLYETISKIKDEIFPATIDVTLPNDKVETRRLFGDMIKIAEAGSTSKT